jgi:hypothetical protein
MKKLIVIPFLLLIYSCNQKPNCEAFLRIDRDSECLKIVKKEQFITAATLGFKGVNPYTNEKCECNDNNRWWYLYRDEINIGDTIIKRKGELTFNIHKRDTIISHEWECDGNTYYPDGSIKEKL